MKIKSRLSLILFSFVFISPFAHGKYDAPLNPKAWKPLKFSKLKANKIAGDDKTLIIEVNKSSSPLLFKIPEPTKFKTIIVKGEVLGQLSNMDKKKQGIFKNNKSITDDFLLRFGLVLEGKNKKPFVPGFLIPKWIKEMFRLAPKGTGVDKIYFLTIAHDPKDIGKTRNHPLSDYIFEESVTSIKSGAFELQKTFNTQKSALGFWISANGEGTSSEFKTKIKSIKLL